MLVPSDPFVSLKRVLSKSIADPILSFSQSNLGFPRTVKKVFPSSLNVAFGRKIEFAIMKRRSIFIFIEIAVYQVYYFCIYCSNQSKKAFLLRKYAAKIVMIKYAI